MKLVIGNKNYSSWSLRPWLLLRANNIPFEEERIPLYQLDTKPRILGYSAAGKVPILVDGDVTIWDSFAIAEYLAERFPDRELWPNDAKRRARARSVTAEMHSGFTAMRSAMSMNCRGSFPGKGATPEAMADVARVIAIWEDCRANFAEGGEFLFGKFSIADAFYAPVATRFMTYGVPLSKVAQRYVDSIHALPAMREWVAASRAEAEVIEAYEIYR